MAMLNKHWILSTILMLGPETCVWLDGSFSLLRLHFANDSIIVGYTMIDPCSFAPRWLMSFQGWNYLVEGYEPLSTEEDDTRTCFFWNWPFPSVNGPRTSVQISFGLVPSPWESFSLDLGKLLASANESKPTRSEIWVHTQQHIPKSYVIRRSDLINFIIVLDSLQAPTPGQTNLDVKWKKHGFPFGKYLHMCLQMEGKHHITSIFNLQGIYLKHPGTAPSNLIAGKVGQHHPNRYRTLAYRDTYDDQTLLVSPSCAIEDTTHRSIRRCLHILVGGWWFGTFFMFPYIEKKHPKRHIFQRGWNHQPDNHLLQHNFAVLCTRIPTHIYIYIYTYIYIYYVCTGMNEPPFSLVAQCLYLWPVYRPRPLGNMHLFGALNSPFLWKLANIYTS